MLTTCKRTVLLFLMVSTAVSWTTLRADETKCQPPASPTLPFAISDDAQAINVSTAVESILSAGVNYLACIQGVIEKGDLTAEEKQRLENAYEAQVSAMRAIADRWNGLYTSHARRKAEK